MLAVRQSLPVTRESITHKFSIGPTPTVAPASSS
jgi:hypothetical protein